MKVILLKDVAKVGQRGSIKEIADGYALNYLIPNGLAEQATPDKVAAHAKAMKQQEDARERDSAVLASTIKSLEGARIGIATRATEKGGLFKSITGADIVRAILSERRAIVPESAVMLEKPIKQIGELPVTIKASGAEARITLLITPATN